jgi:hypothetical protein
MMVAIVREQGHPQRQLMVQRIAAGPHLPCRISRVGTELHPDPRLDLPISEVVGPYRNGVVEMEASDPHMTRRRYGAALPAISEQRE